MNKREEIFTDRLMTPIAHFSHAMRLDGRLHIGATAGTDAARRLAGNATGRSDMVAQAQRMLENLLDVIDMLGSDRDGLVRVKSYIADLRELATYQEVYQRVIGDGPLHVVVGSHGFPLPHASVELDALAVIDPQSVQRSADVRGIVKDGRQFQLLAQASRGKTFGTQSSRTSQTTNALDHLDSLLSEAGLNRSDVVSMHISLVDGHEYLVVHEALKKWCERPRALTCTIVYAPLSDISAGMQIEAIAVPGGGEPIGAPPVKGRIGSPAVSANGYLYIGGVMADEPYRVSNDPLAQTRSCWAQINRILDLAGMTPECVIRTNNILTDWRHYRGFNQGYGEHIAPPFPPRTTMHGGLSLSNAVVQIELLAHQDAQAATVLQTAGFSLPDTSIAASP